MTLLDPDNGMITNLIQTITGQRNAEMDGGPPTLDVLDELKEIHGKQVEDYQKYLEEYNK